MKMNPNVIGSISLVIFIIGCFGLILAMTMQAEKDRQHDIDSEARWDAEHHDSH